MKREPRRKPNPRIGRKDLQDPDRDTSSPREGDVDPDRERSDREAGTDRPVPPDDEVDEEDGRPRRKGPEAK